MKHRSVIGVLVLALVAAACGGSGSESGDSTIPEGSTTAGGGNEDLPTAETVRLGYFPNVTHAPAIVGVVEGLFADELGDTELQLATFNAGTEAIEAMFADSLDITFIGPNPAINGFTQSQGQALRIVSGTTSGGAFLVVNPEITSPDQLQDTTLASPSLGNTQDVALRAWLAEQGYETNLEGGGDVSIVPQSNSQILETFIAGEIDGAWVPEPWATRMILEGGGTILVDEADLWPDGRFVTTHLIVDTEFLEEFPGTVEAILSGLLASLDLIADDPATAQAAVNGDIEAITGSGIAPEVLEASWENLEFTYDPISSSLQESAEDAVTAGLLEPIDLEGIYDLTLLNELLAEEGLDQVESG